MGPCKDTSAEREHLVHRHAQHDVEHREQAGQERRRAAPRTHPVGDQFDESGALERDAQSLAVLAALLWTARGQQDAHPAPERRATHQGDRLADGIHAAIPVRSGVGDAEEFEGQGRIAAEDQIQFAHVHLLLSQAVDRLRECADLRRDAASLNQLGAREVVPLEEIEAGLSAGAIGLLRLDPLREHRQPARLVVAHVRGEGGRVHVQDVELHHLGLGEEVLVFRSIFEVVEGDLEARGGQSLHRRDRLLRHGHRLQHLDHADRPVQELPIVRNQPRVREVDPGAGGAHEVCQPDIHDCGDHGAGRHRVTVDPGRLEGVVPAIEQFVAHDGAARSEDRLTRDESGHGGEYRPAGPAP